MMAEPEQTDLNILILIGISIANIVISL